MPVYTERDFKKVKELRSEGKSHRQISRETGISHTTIGNWLAGKHSPIGSDDPDITPSESLSYVLGVIKGDGSVYSRPESFEYVIWLGVRNKPFAEKFKEKLNQLGMNPNFYVYQKPRKARIGNKIIHRRKRKRYEVKAQSKTFVKWYEGLSSQDIYFLLANEETFKFKFLEGIYESDGSLWRNRWKNYVLHIVQSTNKELTDLVTAILKSIGYHPYRTKDKSDRYKSGAYHYVRMFRQEEVSDFFSNVNPAMKRKTPEGKGA